MDDKSSVPGSGKQNLPWARMVFSILLFVGWMAFLDELHSIWLRALVAGLAFGLLYPAIQSFRRGKRQTMTPVPMLWKRISK
jgi:predicted PurR-regulated permease PerM